MNPSGRWLAAWKAQAEKRRQVLAQVLSQPSRNPRLAAARERLAQRAQVAVTSREQWSDAYGAHLKAVAHILAAPRSGRTTGTGTKGSMGESA